MQESCETDPDGHFIVRFPEVARDFKKSKLLPCIVSLTCKLETIIEIRKNSLYNLRHLHIIDDEITEINKEDFTQLSDSLETLVIECPRLTKINSNTICGSIFPNLKHAKIIAPLTLIDSMIFQNCAELRTMEIQTNDIATILEIRSYFACGCKNLSNVQFFGRPLQFGFESFYNCTSLVNLELNVVFLGSFFCSNATSLKTFIGTDASSMENIEYGAFNSCESLESVQFYNCQVKCVKANAFSGCTKLKFVNIFTKHLEKLESHAFFRCSGLTQVDLSECMNLREIDDLVFAGAGNKVISACTSLKFPKTPLPSLSIGHSFLLGSQLERFEINCNNLSIDHSFLNKLLKLKVCVIRGNVQCAGNNFVSSCPELEYLDIRSFRTAESIRCNFLSDCPKLKFIHWPETFYKCKTVGDQFLANSDNIESLPLALFAKETKFESSVRVAHGLFPAAHTLRANFPSIRTLCARYPLFPTYLILPNLRELYLDLTPGHGERPNYPGVKFHLLCKQNEIPDWVTEEDVVEIFEK